MKVFLRAFSKLRLIMLAFVAAVTGLAYLFGYATAEFGLFPNRYLSKLMSIADAVTEEAKSIQTIFLSLDVAEKQVPVIGQGNGGGLTSFGDELVLISHEGTIFAIAEDVIEESSIEPPRNGLDEYMAAAREEYSDLEHNFLTFRYNDILYVSEDGRNELVVSFTEWRSIEKCYGTTLARLPLPSKIKSIMEFSASGDDWITVYRTSPCLSLKSKSRAIEGHMAGGRIAYLGDQRVVLGSGDYHWDGVYAPDSLAQAKENDYGKVLVIDLGSGESRAVSIGHRNMQGVLVDSDGQIWVTEHGVRGGDELNRVFEGGNFGWPEVTLGTRYNNLPWPSATSYGRHQDYAQPTYAWVPSVATSGLVQIQGFEPSWDGDLLVSTLAGKSLFRLRIRENRVVFAEPIRIGERIRYVHQHSDGRIVLWTDSKKLIFISLGAMSNTQAGINKIISSADYSGDQKKRLRSALDSCMECHSLDPHDHQRAPGLGAIFNSAIANTSYDAYSDSLSAMSGNWTRNRLTRFLEDPQSFAPGTSMPDPGINDQYIVDGIVEILERLRNEKSKL